MSERKKRAKSKTGIIMELITTLNSGDSFLIETDQKNVQAHASRAGIKVAAVNCMLIENYQSEEPQISRVTKVTIV